MVFKTALKPRTFCQKFKLGHDTVSIAFQRYITSPIWAMLTEIQPSTRGSSGRTTQAVKLQKKHNFITTREQNLPASEISI